MRGVPARVIQELAGHQQLSTTERYMHLSPSTLTTAIGALDALREPATHGDIVETGMEETGKANG